MYFIYMVVAMWREGIGYICICMLVYFFVFQLLAHPICLWLVMIVYAVHVSR